jgi:hypothetical protein
VNEHVQVQDDPAKDEGAERLRFQVFRFADARPEDGLPDMTYKPVPPEVMARSQAVSEAGMLGGAENRMLFSGGGVSLAYAWFKSGFPLPRHSHDSDCLYYVVAGSLQLGDQMLGAGDGFFLGAGVPYAYTPGPEGVEILEFRAVQGFDIQMLAGAGAFWDRALETVLAKRDAWPVEARPSRMEG